jgi:hypothetical protein
MNDDLVSRMDKLIGLCPCGAEPRPGEPYCSEDCRPVPGAGVAYYGERWTEWGPAMAAGPSRGARALAHRLIDFAESQGIELTESQRRFMAQMYAFPQRHVCGAEPQPDEPPPRALSRHSEPSITRQRPRLRTCTDGAGWFYTVVTPPRIDDGES